MFVMLAAFVVIAGIVTVADVLSYKQGSAVSLARACTWAGIYLAAALLFAGALYAHDGPHAASLFLTGFVIEKALSVDNLMVFAAIFAYFKIPDQFQHRVLHYGIIGAVVFRMIFVGIGAGALELWPVVGFAFGALVLWSAKSMWATEESDEEVDYANAWYVCWAKRAMSFTNIIGEGGRFFLAGKGTPLFLSLIVIEISDVLFSFDSVPAVISVTQKPFLVYAAMIFAVLGLRNLYFVLTAMVRYLSRLGDAVIAVLFFIGIKMIVQASDAMNWPVPDWAIVTPARSLLVVGLILAAGVAASILAPKKQPDVPSHAPITG